MLNANTEFGFLMSRCSCDSKCFVQMDFLCLVIFFLICDIYRTTDGTKDNAQCVSWWHFVCCDMVFVMASETEKAHALLQTFSTASVISSLGLGIFCFVADRLLQFSFIQQNDWLRALSDNAVHGILGMWSWAIVIGLRKKSDFTEVTLAGFLASVIDVDHFFLAGSLSLKVSQ